MRYSFLFCFQWHALYLLHVSTVTCSFSTWFCVPGGWTQEKSVISFPTGLGFSPLDQAHRLEAGKRIMSRYPFIHISPCFIMSCCLACYQETSSIWLLLYLILASLNLWLVLVLCCYFHKSGAWSLEAFSKPCFYHCEESFYKFPFMTKLEYVCVSYQDPDWFNCYSYISIFYSNNLEKL